MNVLKATGLELSELLVIYNLKIQVIEKNIIFYNTVLTLMEEI